MNLDPNAKNGKIWFEIFIGTKLHQTSGKKFFQQIGNVDVILDDGGPN